MELYLDNLPVFEKIAAEVDLPEDAAQWPQEIMQELYKQVPYVADFHPDVNMETVNAEQGYGFGHFEVQNKTEAPSGSTPEQESQIGVRHVRIPIIVKDFKLQPFDVVVTEDSRMLPLTENRLRQALFRPQAFDVTSRTPGDQSMVGQLYPPYRQNYGFGGGGGGMGVSAGMGKTGAAKFSSVSELEDYLAKEAEEAQHGDIAKRISEALGEKEKSVKNVASKPTQTLGVDMAEAKKEGAATYPVSEGALKQKVKDVVPKVKLSMLDAIKGTIYQGDYDRMAESIGKYASAYAVNGVFTTPALSKLAGFDPHSLERRFEQFAPAFKPDVVQLVRGDDGYTMKSACSHAWRPVSQEIDRGQAVRIFGEKVVLAADMTGSATVEAGPNVEEGEAIGGPAPQVIGEFGLYKVQSTDGRELVGFVIPNLIDVDGSVLPIALFTNGSDSALQAEIAGEPAGAGSNLPTTTPQGQGTFFREVDGEVEATVPMNILGGTGDSEYSAQTFDGKDVQVKIQPNVKKAVGMEGTLVLPEDFQWCPMGEAKQVELVDDPGAFNKQASAGRQFASVTVRAGGEDSFSFDGLPLRKLGSAEKSFLPYDDAVFLLAGLGTGAKYGATKLAESLAFSIPVDVRIGRHITPIEESIQESRKTAEALLWSIPSLKVDLAKEAAFIQDPTAVDTVLSLGFINPENIRTFVSYLPQIEDVEAKLCELLISARLGIKDIPVGALEKTVKTLEDVVQGLRTMAFVGTQE